MLAIERKNEILSTIQKEQSVMVSDLAKKYSVTEETIRRDLDKLEKEGFIKKTYGGAVFQETASVDLPFRIREHSHKDEKKELALKVVELINDGDTLMLDSSSTVLEIVKLLKDKERLTVITNSVEALLELSDCKNITVISTGGRLRESSLSLVGRGAEKVIQGYNVDKLILSCKGIDIYKGVTDSNEAEADIKRAMLNMAKTKILAVDSSKFSKVAFLKIFDISEFDYIVTEKAPDEKWSDVFNSTETKIFF